MMQSTSKRFHVVVWETDDRTAGVGIKYQFDTLAEAVAAFDRQRRAGRYREGVLIQWRQDSDEWELVDRFGR